MKNVLILGCALTMGLAGCKKSGDAPESNEEKSLYAMGTIFGQRVKNLNLTEKDLGPLMNGFRAGALGQKELVKMEEVQGVMQEFIKKRMEQGAEIQKKDGQKYLDKFLAEGGKKTATGLAYKIVSEGTGKIPQPTDVVKVHYHGTLTDGTVFDSSKDRGQPATFPLNRVIKGWTEGVQLIKEGGKITLVVPSELGYGIQGAPPKIPGGSVLIFEVELISIENPAAANPGALAVDMPKDKKGEKVEEVSHKKRK